MGRACSTELPEGKHVINQLSVVLRTAQYHNADNVAVLSAAGKLQELLNALLQEEQVKVDLIGEFFHLNESRVRFPSEYHLNFDYLSREFRRRELGSVTFTDSVAVEEITTFVRAFLQAGCSNSPYETMTSLLEDAAGISIDRLKRIREEEGDVDARQVVKKTYFNVVSFSKGVMTKLQAGEKVSIKKAKRVVESMVDLILAENQLLVGMTAIKDYDDYTYHHSVNVSLLSIAIGQKIGLNRRSLTELGLVALFHDIGKVRIPKEILNKPTSFSEEEWRVMKRHPYWGALMILRMKGLDKAAIQAALVAYQHHIHQDHSGYPELREPFPLDFYSRIVSIADQYDAMTSARVYARSALSPDRALSVMMERAGSQIDPILFKFFINMVGVYPVGSLVLMDTREMGLVYECNPLVADKPRVLIIVDGNGQKVDGVLVDLTEKNEFGRHTRTIVKTLDPNKYKVNLAEYLL